MSDEVDETIEDADDQYQLGYSDATASVDADLERAKVTHWLASSWRLISRSPERDDGVVKTLERLEAAIVRISDQVGQP